MRLARPLLLGSLVAATTGSFALSFTAASELEEELPVREPQLQRRLSALVNPPREVVTVPPLVVERGEMEFEALELTPPEPEPTPPPPRRVHKVARRVEAPEPSLFADPADEVRKALKLKKGALERCYEMELKKQAAFDGFVVVSLSVAQSGKVLEAGVEEGNRRDSRVGACIVAQLKTMRLPAFEEDVELQIPIRLQARELAARE